MTSAIENTESNQEAENHSAIPWIAPLVVYLISLQFDRLVHKSVYSEEVDPIGYLILTLVRVVLVGGLLFYFRKTYLRAFKFRVGFWWLPVGVVGFFAWIGISNLGLEKSIWNSAMSLLGRETEEATVRAAFNPLEGFHGPWLLGLFLVSRFALLVVAIPIAEEGFLRGFLMRYVERADWWKTAFEKFKWTTLLVAPIYGLITHPSEAFAAIVWFSMVTWLMVKTKDLWACVLAHATTNLLLGIYIIQFEQWQLW